FLLSRGGVRGVRLLFNDVRALRMGDGRRRLQALVTEEVEREVSSDREHERTNLSQAARRAFAEQAAIGFLDNVVGVRQCGKTRAQVSAQSRLVRLHFQGEPTGLFALRWGHGVWGWGGCHA